MHTITSEVNKDERLRPKCVRKSTELRGNFRNVSRDLTKEENESARAFMRDLLRQHDGNQSAVAPKLHMVPSGISRFLAGRQGTSRATCTLIAKELNVTVEEVLGHAPRSFVAAQPDRYPDRARALARLRGILPPEVEEQLRSTFVEEADPLTEREWVDLAMLRLKEHEGALAIRARIVTPKGRGQ